MTPLEVAANVALVISILLAARNSVHTWWTGIVACGLFALLFERSQLYADVVLQLFFVATSAWGWWLWLVGQGGEALPVGRSSPRMLLGLAVVGALVTLIYGALLHRFTNAYAPFADSAVLAFSVIAQCLMMKRKLACWPVWLLVNSIAVPLYFSRGLTLTAGLYVLFWFNAFHGWHRWRQDLLRADVALPAAGQRA
ncbi:nicotinamide riboside transporter PnuC [Niveibacterium sp. SC-1]|uniref:nicotinamide riboside transporter PnuC n=1 Tax=Niveibacterium sp. SC-1 TaxID=3135646 RepID=UPI00311EC663